MDEDDGPCGGKSGAANEGSIGQYGADIGHKGAGVFPQRMKLCTVSNELFQMGLISANLLGNLVDPRRNE